MRTPEQVAAGWGTSEEMPFVSRRKSIEKLIASRDSEILKEIEAVLRANLPKVTVDGSVELIRALFNPEPPVPSLTLEDRIARLEELSILQSGARHYELFSLISEDVEKRHMEPKK